MFLEVEPIGSRAFPVSMFTFTFFTFFSIAKTVTGMVTVSPGDSFLGIEVKTIKGLRTGVVLSVLP